MDTSETYIKMCEKAEEIQKECDLDEYNVWSVVIPYLPIVIVEDRQKIGCAIWLPRQDQLQEMIFSDPEREGGAGCHDPYCLLIDFHNFVRAIPNPAPEYSDTFERLWLSYVMKEKFNKTWDGAGWK